MAYKNVGKPTFLFCIFRCIVTVLYRDEHCMKNNLKGELAVMDSLDIKPNHAALGRRYGMDWRTVKKYHNGYEWRSDKRNKGSKLDEYRDEIKDKLAIKRITVQGVYQFMLKKYDKYSYFFRTYRRESGICYRAGDKGCEPIIFYGI